jgi:hypothetical protein
MILRRTFLLAAAIAPMLPRFVAAQSAPKIIVLGAKITSPIFKYGQSTAHRERSLRGWLVCNGALADRAVYAKLFDVLYPDSLADDRIRTFNLPLLPLEVRGDDPVRGTAICPGVPFGGDAGDVEPFDVTSNI